MASPWRWRGDRWVRTVLGLLLLTTAGLKAYGLRASALPQTGWLSAPWVQMAILRWEVILGVWLLSGKYPTGS